MTPELDNKTPVSKRYENRGCANPEDDLDQVTINQEFPHEFGSFEINAGNYKRDTIVDM